MLACGEIPISFTIALLPGGQKTKGAPVCTCAAPQVFPGNLETTVYISVLHDCITRAITQSGGEFQEKSCIQPSLIVCPW